MKKAIVFLLISLMSITAFAQVNVYQLPPNFQGVCFSDDGQTVVGQTQDSAGNWDIIALGKFGPNGWTIAPLNNPFQAYIWDCSSDASTIDGLAWNFNGIYDTPTGLNGYVGDSFYYTAATGEQLLSQGSPYIYGCSGDGLLLAGDSGDFVITFQRPGGAITTLPVPNGFSMSTVGQFGSMSSNGSIITGSIWNQTQGWEICYWKDGVIYPVDIPNTTYAVGDCASRDGSTIAGHYADNQNNNDAITYSLANGLNVYVGGGEPSGLSTNGQVFTTLYYGNPGIFGGIYNPTVGMEEIRTFLHQYGNHALDNSQFGQISRMSPSGTSLLVNSNVSSWVITIPAYAINVQNQSYSFTTGVGVTLEPSAPGVLKGATFPYPIVAELVSGPSHASSFGLNSDGSFTYVPKPGFAGTDTFTFTAKLSGPGNPPANTGTATITVSNPKPGIGFISPSSTTQLDTPFTLTVYGDSFVPTSTVKWNGSGLPTTYINNQELQATVGAQYLTHPGTTFSVTVTNPKPGGGISNAVTFTIPGTFHLAVLYPDTTSLGSGPVTMTVTGEGFIDGCVVMRAGVALSTTYISPNRLTATIPASMLKTAGDSLVLVKNPDGTESNTRHFYVSG